MYAIDAAIMSVENQGPATNDTKLLSNGDNNLTMAVKGLTSSSLEMVNSDSISQHQNWHEKKEQNCSTSIPNSTGTLSLSKTSHFDGDTANIKEMSNSVLNVNGARTLHQNEHIIQTNGVDGSDASSNNYDNNHFHNSIDERKALNEILSPTNHQFSSSLSNHPPTHSTNEILSNSGLVSPTIPLTTNHIEKKTKLTDTDSAISKHKMISSLYNQTINHDHLSPTNLNIIHPHHQPSRSRQVSESLELTVPLYYAGKNVFITGATGFMGKVLVEKLIRSCPDVAGVYCLIRPKNNQTIDERMKELLDSRSFDNLRKEQPDFAFKLHPVEGDVLLPEFGLSPESTAMLSERINIVFHNAATVRFDEPLRKAVEINVLSVRKLLVLCRQFQYLEALVHVSTAYANCDKSHMEEKVYPPPVEPQRIIDIMSWMDDEMIDLFTPKLLGEKPNTYTYTKQLAEHLLVNEGSDLPLAIVRPSIVGAAWKEPFPGWIDNFNGPSGLYIAAGKGILRWMRADMNAVADIVPVDIPINIMIAVGWYTAVAKPKNVHIYHAVTSSVNPFSWGEMRGVLNKSFREIPLEKCFRRPHIAITNNPFTHDYWKFVSHLFPAYAFDMAYALIGRKPRMVKLYNRLHYSMECLQFFTCNEWSWDSSNVEMLRHQLTPEDLRTFYFDSRPLHWPTYIHNYFLGTKKYVLNEDLSGLPAARAHIRKLKIIRTLFNSAIFVILWRVLIAKSNFARNLWFFIVKLVFKFVRFFRITSTMHK